MKSTSAVVAAASAIALVSQPAVAAGPYGIWERPSTGTKVKFFECAGKLCAKIVGVRDAAKKGTVGTVIMGGAKKVGNDKWEGDLLNTENGTVYSGYVTLSGAGLKLQGCALGGLVCSGETWRRAD